MTLDRALVDRIAAGLDLAPGARVVVAMSGGVDSSVAAALMKQLGFETIGITLQLYDHGAAVRRAGACCAGQDIHDARRVAAALGIPHYVLDFEERFRAAVIDEFARGYARGETPVPCIACNRTVKFTDLIARAKALGAVALVTGHYVASRARAGGRDLLTPADTARDQSYFLFATTPAQLDYLRFPLGNLTKAETRAVAARLGLEIAAKPDSQDICFVPDGRYAQIVKRLAPATGMAGDIVDETGAVLGGHAGIAGFTIGQRRGLGLGGGQPRYVVGIDPAARRVTVGPRAALARRGFALNDFTWLGETPLDHRPARIHARIRSSRAPVPGQVERRGDGAWVTLDAAEMAVAPGQACVFYERPGPGRASARRRVHRA